MGTLQCTKTLLIYLHWRYPYTRTNAQYVNVCLPLIINKQSSGSTRQISSANYHFSFATNKTLHLVCTLAEIWPLWAQVWLLKKAPSLSVFSSEASPPFPLVAQEPRPPLHPQQFSFANIPCHQPSLLSINPVRLCPIRSAYKLSRCTTSAPTPNANRI